MVAKLSSFQKVVRTTGVALAWGLGGRGLKSAAPAIYELFQSDARGLAVSIERGRGCTGV